MLVRRILERLAAMMDPKYERRAVWRRHLAIAERLRVNADGGGRWRRKNK